MRRISTLLLAISLVAVPTAFDLYPEWTTGTPLWARGVVTGAWIVVVYLTSRSALAQGERIDELLEPALERRGKQKQLAARRLIGLLLKRDHGLPSHYRFHLYLPDEVRHEMTPVYPAEGDPPSWRYGCGVTGEAWRRKAYVVARGVATHDATFRLTPSQKKQYANLQVIAALPLWDDRQRPIGVLTCSSSNDDGRLVSADGFDRHQELAQICSRILIDVVELPR